MTKKSRKAFRRSAAKVFDAIKLVFNKLWAGLVFIWKHPMILSAILLILAVILFNLLITKTFTRYMNCSYLLIEKMKMPEFFCNGFEIGWPFSVKINALNGIINPPLEFIRKIADWTIAILFAFVSLYLTIMINNLKAIVRIVVLNKEEWKRFMESIRTWLLIFVAFCLTFYFTVIR